MSKKKTLFLDESGKAAPSHWSQYFILSGCLIPTDKLPEIQEVANRIVFKYWGSKRSYSRRFGVQQITFHASQIVNFKGPFQILKDPVINREFWKDLYNQILSRPDIAYNISLVDKTSVLSAHSSWKPETTLKKTYHNVLDGFIKQLIREGSTGEIIAESSHDQDLALVTILNSLQRNSLSLYRSKTIASEKLTSLSLVNKHDGEIGAQIADLMAWTGGNKYQVDKGIIIVSNLRSQEQKLLHMFNRRLRMSAARKGFNNFTFFDR